MQSYNLGIELGKIREKLHQIESKSTTFASVMKSFKTQNK